MHISVHAVLFAALAAAIPQNQPFCSKVASRGCASTATSFCSSYLHLSTVTSTVTGRPKATSYVTASTVYVLPTDFPCYASGGQKREAEILKRKVPLEERARATPACLTAYKSSTALSSACSCLATAATTTKTIKGGTTTITTAVTSTASTFQIAGPVIGTGQVGVACNAGNDGEAVNFYCSTCCSGSYSDVYALVTNGANSCTLQNHAGYYSYMRYSLYVEFYSNANAAAFGIAGDPVTCYVVPDTLQLVCNSLEGSTNRLSTGDSQLWELDGSGQNDFLSYVRPKAG